MTFTDETTTSEVNSCQKQKKKQKTQEMTSKCDTTAKIRLICSVKVWNPPQLNLLILDVRNNIKNLQSLATRTAPN